MKRNIDQIVNVDGLDAEHQNKLLGFGCHLITQTDDGHIFDYLQPIPIGCDLSANDRVKISAALNPLRSFDLIKNSQRKMDATGGFSNDRWRNRSIL